MSEPTPPSAPTPESRVDTEGREAPPFDRPYYRAPLPDAFLRFWKKYLVFTGRASRSEYWWWMLVDVLVGLFIQFLGTGLQPMPLISSVLHVAWLLVTAVPLVALTWRRFHDVNLSGWWAVPGLVAAAYSDIANALGVPLDFDGFGRQHLVLGGILFCVSAAGGLMLFVVSLLRPHPAGERFDDNGASARRAS
ncbi:DUF805 domain-containing protein [Humibacter ginsenosidimutans]|nr:DUF805 domain-containing protein [Humibacter ginsenosidimutans]